MIKKECDTCLSWDVPKNVCLRVMHGMACVLGTTTRIRPEDITRPVSLVDPLPRDFSAGAADNAIYKAIKRAEEGQAKMARYEAQMHKPKASDTQVAGDHYKKMGVEPWDVVDTWPLEQRIGYYRGGALKYIMRMGAKDVSAQEIAKGKHYMEKLLEVLS